MRDLHQRDLPRKDQVIQSKTKDLKAKKSITRFQKEHMRIETSIKVEHIMCEMKEIKNKPKKRGIWLKNFKNLFQHNVNVETKDPKLTMSILSKRKMMKKTETAKEQMVAMHNHDMQVTP